MVQRIFENLNNWDCEVDKALQRFLSDEELYYKCLCDFCNDEAFNLLKQSILNKEYKNVFQNAHSLKGVSANLGLIPIYNSCNNITELVRNDIPCDIDLKLQKNYEELNSQRLCLLNILENTL